MSLYSLTDRRSFLFSAENPTGAQNGGSRGKDCEKLNPCVTLKSGETVTVMETEGPGMITHMWFSGIITHACVLRIYWEGEAFPSVEAPLPAFFGRAYDESVVDVEGKYVTLNSALLLTAPANGYNSYFEMPFHHRCRMTVENRGEGDQILFYAVSGYYGVIPSDAGCFHAFYRQEHPVTKGRAYTVVDRIHGKGTFAGVTLAVGVNGANTCWVEGEVKMYLDGDIYPTLNYTGTEDYFCGSFAFGNDYCSQRYQPYQGLYAGLQAVIGNDNAAQYNGQQRFLLYRFHVKDPVYFSESFRMTIDDLGWTGARYDDFTTVAYWYLDHPTSLPEPLPSETDAVMR